MTDEKLRISTTTDGQPARPGFENAAAPAPIDPSTGMHGAYWVLSEEERAKGFVRPVRSSYQHVGIRPKYPTQALSAEDRERHKGCDYVACEPYPPGESIARRYWTDAQLKSGCGVVTSMGQALSETYARDPKYYGATFCCGCGKHLPVEEFVWVGDGERVGS